MDLTSISCGKSPTVHNFPSCFWFPFHLFNGHCLNWKLKENNLCRISLQRHTQRKTPDLYIYVNLNFIANQFIFSGTHHAINISLITTFLLEVTFHLTDQLPQSGKRKKPVSAIKGVARVDPPKWLEMALAIDHTVRFRLKLYSSVPVFNLDEITFCTGHQVSRKAAGSAIRPHFTQHRNSIFIIIF